MTKNQAERVKLLKELSEKIGKSSEYRRELNFLLQREKGKYSYRKLKRGEVVKTGDECRYRIGGATFSSWCPVNLNIGSIVTGRLVEFRRLIQ